MLRTRSRAPTLAAGACALAVTLAACDGSGDNTNAGDTEDTPDAEVTTTTTPPKRPPSPPDLGECRSLSFADISLYSNASKARECSDEHTAYTFSVKQLPSDVAFEGVEIQNDAVQTAAAGACTAAFVKFIGGGAADRARSRLTVTYFLPDQKGFDLGAHWVRCDVVALRTASSLADLPRDIENYLDSDDAASDYGLCSRGDPATADAELVMCSQEHTYRAVAALRLGEVKAPYPGEDETLAGGKQRCEELISQDLGVSGGFTYVWTYPSTEEWDAGARFGFCWIDERK